MKLCDKMNVYLANQMVMYVKLHNLHWYVYGKGFFTLHEKLEALYDQTADIIDEVAERMLALGDRPVASMKAAIDASAVKELEDDPISCEDTVNALMKDTEYWIQDTKELVALAEEKEDCVTADLFTGYLTEYQKLLWMLKAYSGEYGA